QCAKNGRPAFKNAWGNVIVYVPNFSHYQSAPQRAGTLVHEARHVEGSVHAKGGNDKRWNGNGAWSYNASWLAWYGVDASPAPKGQKCLAGREANRMYKVRFNEGIGPTWRFPACQQ